MLQRVGLGSSFACRLCLIGTAVIIRLILLVPYSYRMAHTQTSATSLSAQETRFAALALGWVVYFFAGM
jgi:hypothetical protein